MANSDLIRGAGQVEPKFVDVGEALGNSLQGRGQTQSRREKLSQSEAKVSKYLDRLGADPVNLSKVPEKYRKQVTNYLVESKNKYAEAARTAGKYAAGTTAYQEAIDTMNSITNSFKNLDLNFSSLKQFKEEDLPDFNNRLVSDANNPEDVSIISNAYTDQYDININELGNIEFQTEKGSIELGSLPKYFNKDFKTANEIFKLNKQIYNSGNKLDDSSKKFLEFQLRNMLQQGGKEAVLSLAADDFMAPGGLGIDEDLLDNPERFEELFTTVVDQYTQLLNNTAESGYQAKQREIENRRAKSRSGRSTPKKEKSSDPLSEYTPSVRTKIQLGERNFKQAEAKVDELLSSNKSAAQKFNDYMKFVGLKNNKVDNSIYSTKSGVLSAMGGDDEAKKYFNETFPNATDDSVFIFTGGKGDSKMIETNWTEIENPFANGADKAYVLESMLGDMNMDRTVVNYYLTNSSGASDPASVEAPEQAETTKFILDPKN